MPGGSGRSEVGLLGGKAAVGWSARILFVFVPFSRASPVEVSAAHALPSNPSRASVTALVLRAVSELLSLVAVYVGASRHSVSRSPASHLVSRSRVKAATPT
eukprot:9658197-Karenia_brevis.AAC.1